MTDCILTKFVSFKPTMYDRWVFLHFATHAPPLPSFIFFLLQSLHTIAFTYYRRANPNPLLYPSPPLTHFPFLLPPLQKKKKKRKEKREKICSGIMRFHLFVYLNGGEKRSTVTIISYFKSINSNFFLVGWVVCFWD